MRRNLAFFLAHQLGAQRGEFDVEILVRQVGNRG